MPANETLSLLLEKAKDDENKARLALNVSQIELDNFYIQVKQIENYRLDYCHQLMQRGQQGLTASEYSHLNKFLIQLDETLAKQKRAEGYFIKNVDDTNQAWLNTRQYRKSIEWLIEKRDNEARKKEAKQEQKLMDELASLAVARLAREKESHFT